MIGMINSHKLRKIKFLRLKDYDTTKVTTEMPKTIKFA